jgi:hypothetical protein
MVSNSAGTCTLGVTCADGLLINSPGRTRQTASPVGQPTFCGSYPCMAPTWSSVQMTNPQSFDFTLKTISPGYHAASDGTDIGANYAAINTALGPDNPLLTSTPVITVTPSTATIPILGSVQFSASTGGVTWSLNGGCTASISAAGIVTATSTAESCTPTATLAGASGSALVTIRALTVAPSAVNLTVGGTQQFSANFSSSWSADAGMISGSGLYTAPSANGTYTVTATALNGGSDGHGD